MRRRRMWNVIAVAGLIGTLSSSAVDGAERVRRLEPRYPEVERSGHPPETLRPEHAPLPETLRRAPIEKREANESDSVTHPRRDSASDSRGERHDPRLRAEATAAAHWAVAELIATRGRAELYRVGFHQGLNAVLHRTDAGRWSLLEGRRRGRLDSEARSAGRDAGAEDAEDRAWILAEREVAAEFADLAVRPRYRPGIALPAYEPLSPAIAEPTLADVLLELPPASYGGSSAAARRHLRGWGYDGERLSRCDRYDEFYDAGWSDAERAFALWLRDRDRSAVYRRLGRDDDRRRFEQDFRFEYLAALGRWWERELLAAFELGYDDGWSYGLFAREELAFRQGYRQGMLEAFLGAARDSFDDLFAARYARAYAARFDDWSTQPKPAIGEIRLADDNDDGVYQPGERLWLDVELLNRGGGDGRYTVYLQSATLEGTARADVLLAARGVTRVAGLEGRIRADVRGRTRAALDVRVGEIDASVPLEIAWPLQLDRARVSVRRDNLAGAVSVELPVDNISRRPLGGVVRLVSTSGRDEAVRRQPLRLEPFGRQAATFTVVGLDPLELIAGEVAFEIEVSGPDGVHDAWTISVPAVATDLGSDDLLRYLLRQAQDTAPPSPERVRRVRELFGRRLRADWRVAVAASGNPYKRDRKQGGEETALARLVGAWQSERHGIRRPEWFSGWSSELLAEIDSWPGIHPLLRKHARRLARELP